MDLLFLEEEVATVDVVEVGEHCFLDEVAE